MTLIWHIIEEERKRLMQAKRAYLKSIKSEKNPAQKKKDEKSLQRISRDLEDIRIVLAAKPKRQKTPKV